MITAQQDWVIRYSAGRGETQSVERLESAQKKERMDCHTTVNSVRRAQEYELVARALCLDLGNDNACNNYPSVHTTSQFLL